MSPDFQHSWYISQIPHFPSCPGLPLAPPVVCKPEDSSVNHSPQPPLFSCLLCSLGHYLSPPSFPPSPLRAGLWEYKPIWFYLTCTLVTLKYPVLSPVSLLSSTGNLQLPGGYYSRIWLSLPVSGRPPHLASSACSVFRQLKELHLTDPAS